jgi:transcription antitermination factor NusG
MGHIAASPAEAANRVDIGESGVPSIGLGAPGARHPECGSHPENGHLIKSATNGHGGCRANAGRKPRPHPKPLGVRWYVVQVAPRQEFRVRDELGKLGLTTWLALLIARNSERIEAAFPGYVFVRFDVDADRWRPICSTAGVTRLFSASPEHPLPLPVGAVEALQARGRAGDGVIDERARPFGLVGEALRVASGPFADFEGLCTWAAGDRVRVLLSVFGRQTEISLPRHAVKEANS